MGEQSGGNISKANIMRRSGTMISRMVRYVKGTHHWSNLGLILGADEGFLASFDRKR